MLDPKLLKDIKRIQLTAGHLATEVLSGNYASAFKGQGMEFAEVREYIPGDDIRSIDWNVTARMSQPFIKKFQEERELTLMILLDVSASQNFTSTLKSKMQFCTELAAVLAYLATNNNDKVGVVLFSDEVEEFIPPKKGRAHIWHIIRSVLTHKTRGGKTRIDKALDFVLRTQKKKVLMFLISDFLAEGYEKNLAIASKRHELICVQTKDPRETDIPKVGYLQLYDQETGRIETIDTQSNAAKKLQQDLQTKQMSLQKLFRRHKIESFTLDTRAESSAVPLVQFLRQRERKMRR